MLVRILKTYGLPEIMMLTSATLCVVGFVAYVFGRFRFDVGWLLWTRHALRLQHGPRRAYRERMRTGPHGHGAGMGTAERVLSRFCGCRVRPSIHT